MAIATLLALGVSLLLAALVSMAIARSAKQGRHSSVPIFVTAVIVFDIVLTPIARKSEAGWELQHNAFYRQVAKADPASYEKIRKILLDATERSQPSQETTRQIAVVLAQALPNHVSHASDDSVLAFAVSMNQTLAQLSGTDPDACFYSLHPEQGKAGQLPHDPDFEKVEEQSLTAMAQMLESASTHPQDPPDPERSRQLIQDILLSLRQTHGNDIAFLNGSAGNPEERKKVCQMTTELFQQLTALPKQDASMAIRYMFSRTAVANPQ